MANSKDPKPVERWSLELAQPGKHTEPSASRPVDAAPPKTGRIVHDARGNAVWDWQKEAGRSAVDSTSAMLRRLELPSLEVEGEKDGAPGVEQHRDTGGGYDPYNQRTPVKKFAPPATKKPMPKGPTPKGK